MSCKTLEKFEKGQLKVPGHLTESQKVEIATLISYAYNEGRQEKETVVYTDSREDEKWRNVR